MPPPSDPDITAAFKAMWDRIKAQAPATCVPVEVSRTRPQPATADRMIFNAVVKDEAKNGWTVIQTSRGCAVVCQRFVLARLPDDSLIAIPANSGETFTISSQFRDTAPQVAMADTVATPALRDEKCQSSRPEGIETRVTSSGGDLGPDVFGGRYAGSWEEEWVVRQCGLRVAVPIAFSADGDGGVYTRIKSDGIKSLTP